MIEVNYFYLWIVATIISGLLTVTVWILTPILKSLEEKRVIYESEGIHYNPLDEKNEPFPTIEQAPTKTLSVIVPSYNEEKRLPKMLDECVPYLIQRNERDNTFTWEVIIVDDGSRDRTKDVGYEYIKKYNNPNIKVLVEAYNRGKGGAIRMGVLHCEGEYIVMADADGATTFSEIEKLEREISQGADIAVGSRSQLHQSSTAKRAWYRNVLMYGFNFLVKVLSGIHGINDTQCGFKLFTRHVAQLVFPQLHLERWAFDIEVLYVATRLHMTIKEVPVKWIEIAGSKVSIIQASISMLRDMIATRLAYVLHIWKLPIEKQKHD